MDSLRQRMECSAQQQWPWRLGFTVFLGLPFLFLFAGCAQIDSLMGNQAASTESQSTAQDKDPAKKQATKKKADESPPTSATEGTVRQSDQEKALAEKKEAKSHVASGTKPKKLPKSQTESHPPTEDVFLSPVPLPSKPAAIGGSGG
jgi:hypothetical protein